MKIQSIDICTIDKDIPYVAINIPNDTCLKCGYIDKFNDKCPQCGSKNIKHLCRVVGYLTSNYQYMGGT